MADKKTRRDKRSRKRKTSEDDDIERIKHKEIFYEQAPPGTIKEEVERPEDCIPDLPENQEARKFLAEAPSKGLWMPLGKQVKVMKCWRCKKYGHRTGDRECPMFISGNMSSEKFRIAHEDPMYEIIQSNKKAEKESRIAQLKSLLEESTTESDSESEDSDQKSKKRKHKKHKSKDERKHKKRKHKHHRSSPSDSDSDSDNKKHHKKQKHKHHRRSSPSDSDSDSDSKKHHKKQKHKHHRRSSPSNSDSDSDSDSKKHHKNLKHKRSKNKVKDR